ncbi:MAG TPA: DUF2269 family protein [Vicinamibacterales bacterium]|nr:DUF2269 family protein [Vicinamibacterales bacterium]
MIQSVVLFAHIVGVLGLFVGLALEWVSLEAVRQATSREEATRWVRVDAALPRTAGIAVALILVSGFYLGARIGVLGETWMRASYVTMILMAIVGGPVLRERMRALRQAATDRGDRALGRLRAAASDATLQLSVRVRIVFGVAVVYLMVRKPEAAEAVLVTILGAVVALVLALARRQARAAVAREAVS